MNSSSISHPESSVNSPSETTADICSDSITKNSGGTTRNKGFGHSEFVLLKDDCPICGGHRYSKKKNDCKKSGELVHCYSHNVPPTGWVYVGRSGIEQSMYAPDKGEGFDHEKHRAELAKLRADHKAREAAKRLQLPTIRDRHHKILGFKAELTDRQHSDLRHRGLLPEEIDYALDNHWLFATWGGYGIAAVDPKTGMLCGAQVAKDDRSESKYTWGVFKGQNKLKETNHNPIACWVHPDFDPTKPYVLEGCEGYLKSMVRAFIRWRDDIQVIVVGAAGAIFDKAALTRVLGALPTPAKITFFPDADSQNLSKTNLESGYKKFVTTVQSKYGNKVEVKFADWGQWRDETRGDCDEYFGSYKRRSPRTWFSLFEFEKHLKAARKRLADSTKLTADKTITLEEFRALKDDNPAVTAQRFRELTNGAQDVFLAAPTASGKTTTAAAIVSEYEYGLARFSRNSLVKDGGRRMGFHDRHDLDQQQGQLIGSDGYVTRVGFCNEASKQMQSVAKAILKHENIAVFDELDHSLKSLATSSTHGKDHRRKFNTEQFWSDARQSDRTLSMSADITDFEVQQFRKNTGRKPFVLKVVGEKKQRTEIVFEDKAEWFAKFLQLRSEGKRIIVMCSYKSDAEMFRHRLEAIAITADNASEYQDFLDDPDQWCEENKPQLLVVSPILATGFSITGDHFDVVMKYTHPNITAESAKQFGDRYRPTVPHYTYLDETSFQYDQTTVDAVFANRLAKAKASANNEEVWLDKDDPYFHYQAESNWSKAYLRADYLARCEVDVANITYQYRSLDMEQIDAINKTISDLYLAYRDEWIEKIVDADNLTPEQAKQYRDREKELTEDQRRALYKYEFAYWKNIEPSEITFDMVKRDKKGKLRKAHERLEMQAFPKMAIAIDNASISNQQDGVSQQDITHHHLRVQALDEIGIGKALDLALSGEEWCNDNPIVKEIAEILRSKRDELKLMGVSLSCGRNAPDNSYFGVLLKTFGLKTSRRQPTIDGVRVSLYRLNEEDLALTKADLVARLPRLQEKFGADVVATESQWAQHLYELHTPFVNTNKQGCVQVENPFLDGSESATLMGADSSDVGAVIAAIDARTQPEPEPEPIIEPEPVAIAETTPVNPAPTPQTPAVKQPQFKVGDIVQFWNGAQWLLGKVHLAMAGVIPEYNVIDERGGGMFYRETSLAPV